MNTTTKTKPKAAKKPISKSEQRRHDATKKPVKTASSTVVSVLVDESGSMASVWDATIAGFNEYVGKLALEMNDQRVYFSAIKFDTAGVRKLQVGVPIKQAITLDRENYRPNGGTPLYDAVGKTIQATEQVVANEKADRIIVMIQTDGQENSSVEFTLAEVKAMIEAKQAKGWQFVFVGAGINAFLDGTRMGIASANTMSYGKNERHTRAMFAATAANSASFGSGIAASMNYTGAQSLAAGEDLDITRAKLNQTGAPPPPPINPTPISALDLTR